MDEFFVVDMLSVVGDELGDEFFWYVVVVLVESLSWYFVGLCECV